MYYYKYNDNVIASPVKLNAPMITKETFEKKLKLKALKSELEKYDYIGVKIAMGVATVEEYAEKIAYTESLRSKIRELEET